MCCNQSVLYIYIFFFLFKVALIIVYKMLKNKLLFTYFSYDPP